MAGEEVRVTAKIDVVGAEQARSKFERVGGSMGDVQRATRQMGEQGKLPPGIAIDYYDRIIRAGDRQKITEQEINALLVKRREELAAIDQRIASFTRKQSSVPSEYSRLLDSGSSLREAYAIARNRRGAIPQDAAKMAYLEGRSEAIEKDMRRLEDLGRSIEEGSAKGTEAGWGRVLMRYGQAIGGILGFGGAVALLAQARAQATQYYPEAADVAGFTGQTRGQVAGLGLNVARRGRFGIYPQETLQIIRAIAAAGGKTGMEDVEQYAGLGLYFGLGREGLARMGSDVVGSGRMRNAEDFRRFAMLSGGLSEDYKLTPAQRTFFLESNKNLIEQMATWYGGRPLSVQDYFTGVNNLMQGLHGLDLPMGGAPVALDVAQSLAQGLSPVGRSFSDLIKTGVMLGISPEDALATGKGYYFGYQQKMNELMRSPDAFVKAIQGFAQTAGGDYDTMAALADKVPGMSRALGILNMNGGLDQILNMKPGQQLSGDLDTKIQDALGRVEKETNEEWRKRNIIWTAEQIEGLGQAAMKAESKLKEFADWLASKFGMSGPTAAAGVSAGVGLGSSLLNGAGWGLGAAGAWKLLFGGGRAAAGAAAGVEAAEGVTALSWLARISPYLMVALAPFTMSGAGQGALPPRLKLNNPTKEDLDAYLKALKEGADVGPPGPRGRIRSDIDQIPTGWEMLTKAIGDLARSMESWAGDVRDNTRTKTANPPHDTGLRPLPKATPGPPRG